MLGGIARRLAAFPTDGSIKLLSAKASLSDDPLDERLVKLFVIVDRHNSARHPSVCWSFVHYMRASLVLGRKPKRQHDLDYFTVFKWWI